MGSLVTTAQNIMDLYYQQYKSMEDFFELYHFQFLAEAAYAKILQDEYEKSYRLSLQENRIGIGHINPQWFVPEDVKLQKSDMGDKEAVLKSCPFTFRFDMQSTGIQGVYPIDKSCGEFIRISVDDVWKLRTVPNTNIVWWYPFGNKIIFSRIHCGLDKVRILYVPSLDEKTKDCNLSESMTFDITQLVLQLMFAARQGIVIDMTADGNPNKVIETEINTAFKNLKTNP